MDENKYMQHGKRNGAMKPSRRRFMLQAAGGFAVICSAILLGLGVDDHWFRTHSNKVMTMTSPQPILTTAPTSRPQGLQAKLNEIAQPLMDPSIVQSSQ